MLLKLLEALSDKQNIGFLIWICLYFTKVIYINNQCTKFYLSKITYYIYIVHIIYIRYIDYIYHKK